MIPKKLFNNLTTVSFLCRYAHTTNIYQQSKIFMTDLSLRHFVGRRRCLSRVKILSYSTFNYNHNHNHSHSHRRSHKYINNNNNNLLEDAKENNNLNRRHCKSKRNKDMDPYADVELENGSACTPAQDIPEPLSCEFINEVTKDLNKLPLKFRYGISQKRYKDYRQWKSVSGTEPINTETDFSFKILSYNILAQNLLESHYYLYKSHNKNALDWGIRKLLVQKEIIESEASVICIQEMQVDHLQEFLVPFIEQGFDYLYKKRTNDTRDGLLLLYRPSLFKLEDYVYVEYHQTFDDILNRDNVGVVVKFALVESPDTRVVISTTHLLYNPKRNDVRLAQTQILFAELDRIAFIRNTANGPEYHPIIICGDFNFQPFTGVYKFITEGSFNYVGKGHKLDESGFRRLSNSLIPSSLLVTDNCQHFNVVAKRFRGHGDEKIMLYRNEDSNRRVRDPSNFTNEVDPESYDYQKVQIVDGQYAHFSSGALRHAFKLSSVYQHVDPRGEMEATTNQGEWITVDYIFYTDVEVTSKYSLPTVRECETLPLIPNFVVGSDHLCLGATFKLKKKPIAR
ncbi:protein angel homolog 2 isoform X1 [Microplitis demolitor]|uniref:protein angel homolog 2 isoform X1 n=1 Tax=Microplitis demolitor TaxID=69319 RepID=UPI0004CCD8F4|nr:protein angel homolog 2 isoform X1 [Microplitis demolitor]